MKTKTCQTCNEDKPVKDFYPYRKYTSEKHDGYRPHCISCSKIKEKEGRKRAKERAEFSTEHGLVRAIGAVPGIENCTCKVCWHFNRCRDTEVDCKNFRVWTSNGRVNNYSKMPDRYLIGGRFDIEL